MTILLAISLGLLFGFVLQRVGAANPQNIINMLRLTDLHLMKAILLAIGLSSLLLFLGMSLGVIDAGHLSIKASYIGVVIGGAILGVGFAVAGYCPGTGLAALGDGRKDALAFVIGGLVGAGLFMLAYPWFNENNWLADIFGGKVTLAQTGQAEALLSASGVLVASVIALVLMLIARLLPSRIRG
jgi:hypothetical protein